jgi:hypothetical protein
MCIEAKDRLLLFPLSEPEIAPVAMRHRPQNQGGG